MNFHKVSDIIDSMLQTQETIPNPSTSPSVETDDNQLLKIMAEKTNKSNMTQKPLFTIVIAALIVITGTGTGFGLSKVFSQGQSANITKTIDEVAKTGVAAGDVIGNPSKDSFKDSAEGILVKGGVGGEGSHHLVRPGGKTQNVYLTSSVLDLDQLIDHKVEVWGDTFSAQKAGWLMDVGRAEIKELNAQKPEDYKE